MLLNIATALTAIADNVAARKLTLTAARKQIGEFVQAIKDYQVADDHKLARDVLAARVNELSHLHKVASFVRDAGETIAAVYAFDATLHAVAVAANKPAYDKAEAERVRQEEARAALVEKQRKELAALEGNQAIERLLPVAPRHIVNSSIGDMCCYKVNGLRGAIELIKKFPVIVPMVEGRNGFVRVSPAEMLGDGFTIKEGEMYSARFDIEGGIDRHVDGAQVAIDFWTRINGKLLHIKIDITGPDYIGHYNKFMPSQNIQRGYANQIISLTWTPNKYASTLGRAITWATGDNGAIKKSFHHDHLILADHWEEKPVSEFWELFDRLEALITLVEEVPLVEIVENAQYERDRCGEYPLFSENTGCPTARYVGGTSKALCECSDPNKCPGVNAVRKWYGTNN